LHPNPSSFRAIMASWQQPLHRFWRCGFHINSDRALDLDHVVEPVAELDALVGFLRHGLLLTEMHRLKLLA